MAVILQYLSSSALISGIEANLFDLFSLFRNWPKAKTHEGPEMLWTLTDIPFPLFNSVLRARLPAGDVDTAIEAAITRCKQSNVPMLWWTGPSTYPSHLAAHLESRGFIKENEAPGMAVDLTSLNDDISVPADFVIQQVADAEALKTWCRVFAANFEMPGFVAGAFFDLFRSLGFDAELPLRNYVGRLNGEPVATSTMFFGAGVAGIYDVSTAPSDRRKGIGAAMTLNPLRAARAKGYRAAILHASAMGAGVYRSLGFREFCRIVQYRWSPEPKPAVVE